MRPGSPAPNGKIMNWHVQRLREELRKELGLAIAEQMSDPRIPDVVTITEVRLAPDCRNATVMVSVLGDDAAKNTALGVLNHAAPFLQHIVAKRIVMKFIPKLYFKLDKTLAESEHMSQLFKEIQDDLA
jgi:ribosome-binding factor A